MPGSILEITIGGTAYSFDLVGQLPVSVKPFTGEVQRQTGSLLRSDVLDAPWSITDLRGIGVSRVVESIEDAEFRAWETPGVDSPVPGVICLGPAAQATTDLSGTRQVVGFAAGLGRTWYWSENTSNSVENIAYFVGSTTTWTSATATADWEAGAPGATGFACRGMVEHSAAGTARMYALRSTGRTDGAVQSQLIYSTNLTTWTLINHANAADMPGAAAGRETYFLLDIAGTLYTLTYTGTIVQLRQSTNDGTTWTDATGGTLSSNAAPRGLLAWRNPAGGALQIYVTLQEGVFRWNGTTFFKEKVFSGDWQSQNGRFPQVWPVGNTDFLMVSNERRIWRMDWQGADQPKLAGPDVSPTTSDPLAGFISQGLPPYRDGPVVAMAASPNFFFASFGGDASTRTGGVWRLTASGRWFGPIWNIGTANRRVRAMFFSSYDDGIPRLHVAYDNGTASDTDQIFLEYVDRDPRTVSGYKHAASGSLILAKNGRGLPEISGIWRRVEALGTGFSANNNIGTIYASADAAPLAADGSWGTDMGGLAANAGYVNFVGTPSGTGISARSVQLKFDLAGTSNNSCYIETLNIYVVKRLTPKYIRTYIVDLDPGPGTIRTRQDNLDDLESIVAASTDLSVVASGEAAIVMEPYFPGGRVLTYSDDPNKPGTARSHMNVRYAQLQLVDV